MRLLSALAGLAAVLLPPAAAARPAERHWHCQIVERLDGAWVWFWQGYRGPDRPMGRPMHQVLYPDNEVRGGIHFAMNSGGTWPALDAPFQPPARVSVGIPLPARSATRAVTLYAPGVAPIVGRASRWLGSDGVTLNLRDRRQALGLLTNRDWTAVILFPDGRVQHIVPFRLPMGLEELRAQRARQLPRLRALGHDPAGRCTAHDEAD